MVWTPDQILFLACVAAAIAFLVGSEAYEAWRPRVPVPIRQRRRTRRLPPEGLHRIGLD